MADLNDLNRPVTTDTEPDVLDTLRAHIVRAATWSGWGSTANKVAGLMSATTAAVSGGRSLRLYRRNDANTADEEIVSLPGVSVGGNAATASAVAWSGVTSKPAFFGDATATWTSPTRVVNTIYQNTTGRALAIFIAADSGALQIGTTTSSLLPWMNFDGAATGGVMMVPSGWFYRLASVGFDSWREM